MRMLLNVKFCPETFNKAVQDGSVGQKLRRLLEDAKPEAVYFTEQGGQRSVIMIVEVAESSRVPSLAEPWFLTFKAEVAFHVVMTPEDLHKAGLEELGKKWS
jgi:hypothetical protein